MSRKVKVLILRTAGTNCDQETAYAFTYYGAQVDLVHINQLQSGEITLHDYHILAIPGGFTYGDDIESGRVLANEIKIHLGEAIRQFVSDGKLIIGICNGFQVLVKAGILPGALSDQENRGELKQISSLTFNDSNKFEDRWVQLKVCAKNIWTEGLKEMLCLPVAHAEGKFVTQDDKILKQLEQNGQVLFRYTAPGGESPRYPDNPNGSVHDIAGITDRSGRILGLMPHPERHFLFEHHPHWHRLLTSSLKNPKTNLPMPFEADKGDLSLDKKRSIKKTQALGDGAKIFDNAVKYAEKNLI